MHTTLRAFTRLGLLCAIGLGIAVIWAAIVTVLAASDARASDRTDEGLLSGVTKIVEDVTEPVVDQVVAPVTEKVAKPVTEKVVKPTAEKVVAPVVEKVAKPVTDKVVAPVAET